MSYPFLWNASRQDKTQWNGAVDNGLFVHALGRNTGEVFGVFADFKPKAADIQIPFLPKIIDFTDNSADFAGLQTLEEQIVQLKPPAWPRDIFPIDNALAARGKPLFEQHCNECHAKVGVAGARRARLQDAGARGRHRREDGAQRRAHGGPRRPHRLVAAAAR